MSSVNLAASRPYASPPLSLADAFPAENTDGVSWRAVIAGAVAACALSFILFTLGTGLGLTSVSPWRYEGVEASTLAISAVLWVIFTQLAASGIGGYMAGRLRARWTHLRDHEVYFRDTAHGLLAWGLSTLIMAALMGAVLTGAVDRAASVAGTTATVASTAMGNSDNQNASGYWIDALLRTDAPAASGQVLVSAPVVDPASDNIVHAQAGRVLAHALQTGTLSQDDSRFLAQLVSQRTGLSQAAAQARVDTVFGNAKKSLQDAATAVKQHADDARKATAYVALWMVVAMLAGAFIAALLATYGGRQRDASVVTDA